MGGYGRFFAWMSVIYGFCLAPLVILAFIHPEEAAQRFHTLCLVVGIYVVTIGPTLYVSLKRDPIRGNVPLETLASLPPAPEPRGVTQSRTKTGGEYLRPGARRHG